MVRRGSGHGRKSGPTRGPRGSGRRILHLVESFLPSLPEPMVSRMVAAQAPHTGNVVTLVPRGEVRRANLAGLDVEGTAQGSLEHWIQAHGEMAALTVRQIGALTSPAHAIDLWSSFARRSMEAGMVLALAFTGAGASMVRAGLEPLNLASGRDRR